MIHDVIPQNRDSIHLSCIKNKHSCFSPAMWYTPPPSHFVSRTGAGT
ncbi:hypothetical protein HMPREF0880_04025 [Yokenella regensburgei ATCC 43003]|nr:hypothetical protein HMPREF0880_04025 [Yokenella regensburgei ATCC 43003]